jgi:Pectate lyase superfamily protein
MIRFLARVALCCAISLVPGRALAQSQIVAFTPGQTLTATALQQVQGGKVDVNGGASTNQTLTAPSITGGTLTATDASAAVALAAGSSARRAHAARFADVTNVLDYGAVASPGYDNTAAFQAAINAACAQVQASGGGASYPSEASAAGGDVFVPQGKYGIVGPVHWSCPVNLHGSGPGTTTLVWTGSGSSALLDLSALLTVGGRYWLNGSVRDLDVDVSHGSQTGAVVRVAQCQECVVDDFKTFGATRSVVVYAGAANTISNFNFNQMAPQATVGKSSGTEAFSTAIEWYGSDNSGGAGCTASNNGNCLTRGDILSVWNGHVDSATGSSTESADCLYVHDFAATTWVKNLSCNQTRIGLNVRCDNSVALGNCPEFFSLDRFENESNNSAGYNNNENISADNFAHIICMNCELYASQAGPNNIVLNNTRFHSGNFEWFGGKIQNATGICVLSRIDGLQMHGGVILGCGQDGNANDEWGIGLYPGTSGNSTNNQIVGVQFCHDNLGGTTSGMSPVLIGSAATYTLVADSGLQNCAAGSSNQNSSGHNLIVNEIGP